MDQRYRINSPQVVCEEFDEEIIIVKLETGTYFSTRDSGAEMWRLLADGAPLSAVEAAILRLYDVDRRLLSDSLRGFVSELCEHHLLVRVEDTAAIQYETSTPATERRQFQTPALDSYSDMQDLLVLDPIHEVDEAGWPNPK